MLALTIDIDALARALDDERPRSHYLDLQDGTLLTLPPDAVEPGTDEKYGVDSERYLRIRPLCLEQKLEMREAFVRSLGDHELHLLLSQALQGRRPLRSFAYQIEQQPALNQAWQQFHSGSLQEHALEWLQMHELHPRRAQPSAPGPFHRH